MYIKEYQYPFLCYVVSNVLAESKSLYDSRSNFLIYNVNIKLLLGYET